MSQEDGSVFVYNLTKETFLAYRAKVADSFEMAVRGADVVACCTDAREPILRRD